jgi:lambda repressor-like predicted transcriptional regulator
MLEPEAPKLQGLWDITSEWEKRLAPLNHNRDLQVKRDIDTLYRFVAHYSGEILTQLRLLQIPSTIDHLERKIPDLKRRISHLGVPKRIDEENLVRYEDELESERETQARLQLDLYKYREAREAGTEEAIAVKERVFRYFPNLEQLPALPILSPTDKASAEKGPSQDNKNKGLPNRRAAYVCPILNKNGWSIRDWAQESNVDYKTAASYVKGKGSPYASTKKKLADSLGVPVEQLPT